MMEVGVMKHYEAASRIAADPDQVWSVLADGGGWSSWNSGVAAVDGRLAPGETVRIHSEAAPGRTFPVRVTEFDAPHRLVLTGGMPLGLFRGVRTYSVTPDGSGTLFRMREEYTGPLLGLIWRSMPDLQGSFDQFVAGLKERVESRA
jgi:uncharacterized protein YndB with AHSA1/START domain